MTATALTIPLVVVLALVLGALAHSSSKPTTTPSNALGVVTASPPPHGEADAQSCNKVLALMPVQLAGFDQRKVVSTPASVYVLAWGAPPIVLSCGVNKPADLTAGSVAHLYNAGSLAGPYYEVSTTSTQSIFTIIDRAPFIAITIPNGYQPAPILNRLVGLVGEALPKAACTTDQAVADPSKLCSRRRA